MLRSILFGSMSLSGTKKPSTSTVGYLWGVKHVTPGAIAFVSVLVCPLCSVNSPTTVILIDFVDRQFIFIPLMTHSNQKAVNHSSSTINSSRHTSKSL